MVLQRCCQWLVGLVAREGESADERRRKEIWMPLTAAVLAVGAVIEVGFINRVRATPLLANVLAMHLVVFFSAVGLLYPLATRSLPVRFTAVIAMLLGAASLLADITTAAERASFRTWTCTVLIMDFYLAIKVPRAYQHVVLHSTAVWVLITYVEDTFRLGLYDVEHLAGSDVVSEEICGCANPPCGRRWNYMLTFLTPCLVLYCDFFVTRDFAEGLQEEQHRVLASVVTAERVAAGLAGFDLAAAAAALDQPAAGPSGGGLPQGLAAAFRRLLGNLARYRPYLPQSCFEEADGGDPPSSTSDGSRSLRESAGKSRFSLRRQSGASSSSGGSASASSLSSSSRAGVCPVRYRHAQHRRRATVLVRNSSGFLPAARELGDAVQQWLAEEVERFAEVVSLQGGVTDLFSGDHFSATFGAVKVQGSQCTAATRAAKALSTPETGCAAESLAPLPATAAACCGKALCGDFGSATAQRFMVIGGVSAFVVAAERAAAAWGVGVLISSAVHADAEQLWSCRLRKRVAFPKLDSDTVALWEVLGERLTAGENDEWMYQLGAAQGNPWEKYNAAVTMWCAGAASEVLQETVAAGLDGAPSGGEVAGALRALRISVQEGAPAPVGDLTAAALAGEPSPVAPRSPPLSRERQPTGAPRASGPPH